jgi:colicin import membrane protein
MTMSSGPSGRREESVKFSLKELMKLEDERLAEQARERAARERAVVAEQENAERRRRAEAEAASRASAEAKEREQNAKLDDLARREAMQKAIVEQSRLAVDVRARAEERELERRHELELMRLRAAGKTAQMGPLAVAALLGGAVMLAVLFGLHFGVTKPASDRRIAELQLDVAAAEGRTRDESKRTEEQRRANEALDRKLSAALAELASSPRGPKAAPGVPVPMKPGAVTAPPAAALPKPAAQCPDHDPMCGAIPRPAQ